MKILFLPQKTVNFFSLSICSSRNIWCSFGCIYALRQRSNQKAGRRLGFGAQHQYFIDQGSTDVRKGFYGLSSLVRNELGSDPLSGAVYVFFTKSRKSVKLLLWEGDGFVVYAKRLELRCYEVFNKQISDRESPISYQHFVMLLSSISLVGIR